MPSLPPWFVPALFAALAVLFASLAWRDHRRSSSKPTPKRRSYQRIALIFAVVSLALFAFSTSG